MYFLARIVVDLEKARLIVSQLKCVLPSTQYVRIKRSTFSFWRLTKVSLNFCTVCYPLDIKQARESDFALTITSILTFTFAILQHHFLANKLQYPCTILHHNPNNIRR